MKISGNKLKAAREAASKSRAELAATAGLNRVRIWQIEEMYKEVHMNDHIVKVVAKFIGVRPKDLEA